MFRKLILCMTLVCSTGTAAGEDAPKAGDKLLEGMSIVGNDEAPKSLAIVPWKDSNLGDALDGFGALDAGRKPVDKEVFVRALNYYEIRAGSRRANGAARN